MRYTNMLGPVVVLVLSGCNRSGCISQVEQPDVVEDGAPKALFAATLPTSGDETPTLVVVKNHTGKHVQLDVTWSKASFVTVAPLDASLGTLSLDRPELFCSCPCQPDSRCARCAPPTERGLDLAPGEIHEIAWNGRLVRYRTEPDKDTCHDAFSPPPGLYIISVCDRTRQYCAAVRMKLPSRMPVVLALKRSTLLVDRCPLEQGEMERLATYHLVRMELSGVEVNRLAACEPTSVVCVDQPDLPAMIEGAGEDLCSLLVIPRRSEIESVVVLPVEGNAGEERTYSAFFDLYGTQVLRIRHGD